MHMGTIKPNNSFLLSLFSIILLINDGNKILQLASSGCYPHALHWLGNAAEACGKPDEHSVFNS